MADLNKYMEQLQSFDVNDIDWDRIGVWPLPARIFLFLVASVALVFACHFFVVKEKNEELAAVERQEITLYKSFESKAFEATNLERYRLQMIEMEQTFGTLVSRLPSDTEVPGLLEDIDDKGVESRLDIEKIELQAEKSTEFHIELPIKIIVTGGYHEFGTFVSGIAGMPRIVTLHDFKVGPAGKDSGQLTMEIIAKTYRYKGRED